MSLIARTLVTCRNPVTAWDPDRSAFTEMAGDPEKIDPVDGREYTREWLEQVISNVRPRVDVTIHPARADGDGVIYVVDVPPGTTAYQARDYRYYRRYNFEAVPMEDHEVRDVMNRLTVPDVLVEFSHITSERDSRHHVYSLRVVLVNKGPLSVRRLKLDFTFPDFDWTFNPIHKDNIRLTRTPSGDFRTEYYPLPQFGVLFPGEERDITDEIECPCQTVPPEKLLTPSSGVRLRGILGCPTMWVG